ncbi:MAG: SRPBCC family protein [Chloroflexi bacterium]|nr:SRPBCC family protein [Chloroflexota bacterium]
MQTISCSRWIGRSPSDVYEVLTDPAKLVTIVKRLAGIEVLHRDGDVGRVKAILDLPGGKHVATEGKVTGRSDSFLSFTTSTPFELEITWELTADLRDGIAGTDVVYRAGVDFGPMIEFLSKLVLSGYLTTEMERDLDKLEGFLANEVSPA